jgi:hypothetical protein
VSARHGSYSYRIPSAAAKAEVDFAAGVSGVDEVAGGVGVGVC